MAKIFTKIVTIYVNSNIFALNNFEKKAKKKLKAFFKTSHFLFCLLSF